MPSCWTKFWRYWDGGWHACDRVCRLPFSDTVQAEPLPVISGRATRQPGGEIILPDTIRRWEPMVSITAAAWRLLQQCCGDQSRIYRTGLRCLMVRHVAEAAV